MPAALAQNALVARQAVIAQQRTQRARAVTVRAQAQDERRATSWTASGRSALVAGAAALSVSLVAAPVFAKESYGVYFIGAGSLRSVHSIHLELRAVAHGPFHDVCEVYS